MKLIERKKAQNERAKIIYETQDLITEIDAVEWLLAMTRKAEAGQSLDGLPY